MIRAALPIVTLCACTQTLEKGFSVSLSVEVSAAPALEAAAITVASAELEACPETSWLSLIGTAWAHEASSPTSIGAPHVIQLDDSAEIGTFLPPPDRYCALVLTLGPADDDADGVDDALVGYTLGLTIAGHPRLLVGGAHRIELPLGPLVLDANDRDRAHALTVTLDAAHWLDGVDSAALDSATSATRIVDNIAASASFGP
jgi:hypothetical protein